MEIIGSGSMSIHSISGPKLLQFHAPSLHTRSPFPTSFQFPVLRKLRTTTCSLADDTTLNTTTKVAVKKDSSLAVKKKASDILSALKGTDSLVLEAAGGEAAAKDFKESDEKGYREAETEVLKQLSSMGRLVVCAGNGAVQSSTNLALLRHGICIWIDVPLDMVGRGVVEDKSELPASEVSALYKELRDGYATADATISLQKVASQLGYDDLDAVTTEDMALEVLKEIERLTRVKKLMEEAARPF